MLYFLLTLAQLFTFYLEKYLKNVLIRHLTKTTDCWLLILPYTPVLQNIIKKKKKPANSLPGPELDTYKLLVQFIGIPG